jgi:inner membrane transporter RhtA
MGLVVGLMNPVFYLAIDRLPLGTVAAIEFLPVVVLAAAGVRNGRNAAALGAAVGGVVLLTEVRIAGEPLGFGLAFANAALFALYIVLAHRVSREPSFGGLDGLAAAMFVALVVVTPIGAWSVLPVLTSAAALGAGVGVGVTSSVIPYVCDQLAMQTMTRATYALAVSLLPATATAIGAIVLAQVPSLRDVLGVALVAGGVAVHDSGAYAVEHDLDVAAPVLVALGMLRRLDRRADERAHVPGVDAAADRFGTAGAPDEAVTHVVQLVLQRRDILEGALLDSLEEEPVATARGGRDPDELFECRAGVRLVEQLVGADEDLLEPQAQNGRA